MVEGGGVSMVGGTVTLLDSRIADSSSASYGGCVYAGPTFSDPDTGGTLILRNTTLSNCSAPNGSYVYVSSTKVEFTSEMLILEHPCAEEHSGALIHVVGTAPVQARDMKVHTCASLSALGPSRRGRGARGCGSG